MLRRDDVTAHEAFVVRDRSLKDIDAPFFKWLEENGFKKGFSKGHFGCDWVFVSITHKLYAYGMPGVAIVKETGGHAITLDEFFAVWKIFAKYEGLDVLAMDEAGKNARGTERYYVRAHDSARESLYEFLTAEGFVCGCDDRDEILGSRLPLDVNVTERRFGLMENVTYDGATRRVIEAAVFVCLYKKSGCAYEEYLEAVRCCLWRKGYSHESLDEYFSRDYIARILKENYERYVESFGDESGPVSAAVCLDLMY